MDSVSVPKKAWSAMRIWLPMVLAPLIAGPVPAHHAEAVFDHSAVLTTAGTVRDFLWANPHTLIYLETADAGSHNDVLVLEGGSAIVMRRSGWSPDTLKVGDKLTVTYHPRRDHKPGGMLLGATTADGRTFTWRLPASG